jgi:hypothetical protein
MNNLEFDTKYLEYLEEGHYGLDVTNEEFIDWLDTKFQEFITYPNFKYSQIKFKFGQGRFYCEGLPDELVKEVEDKITSLKNG